MRERRKERIRNTETAMVWRSAGKRSRKKRNDTKKKTLRSIDRSMSTFTNNPRTLLLYKSQ